jgi:uncharacterized membrane protein
MSEIIVLTFDNENEAGEVLESLRKAQRSDHLSLDDTAVVVKDAEGKIHVKNEVDRGVKVGIIGGGLLGLLIGGLVFPFAGLLFGGVAGGIVGKLADTGVDQKFVKDVSEALTPESSAIFFLVRSAYPDAALATLKPYQGEVFHTSLSTEAEENLRSYLKKRE